MIISGVHTYNKLHIDNVTISSTSIILTESSIAHKIKEPATCEVVTEDSTNLEAICVPFVADDTSKYTTMNQVKQQHVQHSTFNYFVLASAVPTSPDEVWEKTFTEEMPPHVHYPEIAEG